MINLRKRAIVISDGYCAHRFKNGRSRYLGKSVKRKRKNTIYIETANDICILEIAIALGITNKKFKSDVI